ncbi:MAG: alpha/beta fold hydrolase [Actinomycetota bacterium]
MPFAELSAGRFFYEEQGEGPAILFSHGIYMDHSSFSEQVKFLSNRYRCIAWDERNHGETEVAGPISYWDHADDLFALMDHLDVDRAILVGMSQGGFIGLRAALKAPERVRALVFIATQAGLENPDHKEGYDAMHEEWMTNGPNEMMLQMIADTILGPRIEPRPWIERWRTTSNERIHSAYSTLISRDDVTERLPEIACPALVIHGDQDLAIPMERADALASGLPGAGNVAVVPGAGHSPQMADPDVVNEELRDFLERLP